MYRHIFYIFKWFYTGGVVGDLHGAVLFDPQLSRNEVVHATVDVAPGVRLSVSATK